MAAATSAAVDIVEQCPEELHPQLFPAIAALPQAAVQASSVLLLRMCGLHTSVHAQLLGRQGIVIPGWETGGHFCRLQAARAGDADHAGRLCHAHAAYCSSVVLLWASQSAQVPACSLCMCCMLSSSLEVWQGTACSCRERASGLGC